MNRSGKAGDELRDVPPGGVHLDRHRDGVAVVLDQVDDRQLEVAGGVERLPELAFARRAVARGARARLRRPAKPSRSRCPRAASTAATPRRSRRPAGTACRWATRCDTMLSALWPQWLGHLAAAGVRIVGGADGREQHLRRRSCRARGRARGRGSRGRTSRRRGGSTMPAAVSTASWPAPEIWKKILFWRLSWISLSSSRRDRSMVRYMSSRSAFSSLAEARARVEVRVAIALGRGVVVAADDAEKDAPRPGPRALLPEGPPRLSSPAARSHVRQHPSRSLNLTAFGSAGMAGTPSRSGPPSPSPVHGPRAPFPDRDAGG